jgi:hypothetical protein
MVISSCSFTAVAIAHGRAPTSTLVGSRAIAAGKSIAAVLEIEHAAGGTRREAASPGPLVEIGGPATGGAIIRIRG